MAFQFVPNDDGSFTEGDKQTNPETNQEYIFTDGAWRALGSEVAPDLTELDARYLKLSGGTLTNRLFFEKGDGGANLLISPNSSDTSSSIYAMNSGSLRLRSIPAENTNDGSSTHIGIGKGADGTPETAIYHLQDPQDELWAANKRYVDSMSTGKTVPPGLRFKYRASSAVVSGEMGYYMSYDDIGYRIKLSKTSLDVTWNEGGIVKDVQHPEELSFTIYCINENKWNIIRSGTINRIDWHDEDILCYVAYVSTNGNFSSSKDYYITIAGIC